MPKYYWEKQGPDKLCAVHTLNSLVQGPIFTEVTLASAARELDAQEKKFLGLAPDAPWESQNVDADGNFSLPAMEQALKTFGTGVSIVNMRRGDVKASVMRDCCAEQAYIVNAHEHWYCVRKVNGRWYDFNSLKPAPTYIGDFALSAFLEQAMSTPAQQVFVCRPLGEGGHETLSGKFVMDTLNLPDTDVSCKANGRQRQLRGHQYLLDDKDMDNMHKQAQQSEAGGIDGSFGNSYNNKKDEKTDWNKLGGGHSLAGGSSTATAMDTDMDPELAAAIALSMADMAAAIEVPEPAPEPAEGGLTIMIRFKSDEPIKRVFEKTAPLKAVFAFVEWANQKQDKFSSIRPPLVSHASQGCYSLLKSGFPKKEKFVKRPGGEVFLNEESVGDKSLADCGIGNREALMLQLD